MEKFEYKVVSYNEKLFLGYDGVSVPIEDEFERLGNDGWEMVTCSSAITDYGVKRICCIFKRKKNQ